MDIHGNIQVSSRFYQLWKTERQMLHGWVRTQILLQSTPAFRSTDSAMQMVELCQRQPSAPVRCSRTICSLQGNSPGNLVWKCDSFKAALDLISRFTRIIQKTRFFAIAAPIESGATSILINAGNIQNKGIEISIDATPVSTSDFSWNTALNLFKKQEQDR